MDDVLRRRQADAGERPAMAVLIGQIAAQGFGVAAAQVELRKRVGERPAVQSGMHAAGGVKGIDQAGEIKLLDLLIEQRIGPCGSWPGIPSVSTCRRLTLRLPASPYQPLNVMRLPPPKPRTRLLPDLLNVKSP